MLESGWRQNSSTGDGVLELEHKRCLCHHSSQPGILYAQLFKESRWRHDIKGPIYLLANMQIINKLMITRNLLGQELINGRFPESVLVALFISYLHSVISVQGIRDR